MAERQKSKDGEKETEKVIASQDRENGVPGAHGKGDEFDNGVTGSSAVRGDHKEIEPSENVDNDKT